MQRIEVGLLTVLWLSAAKAETRGVRIIGASSSLQGKTRVMEWSRGKPYWTDATFQPASAMDDSLATSWCEGAAGPGIGQWIEVQTDRPTREVEIAGGFRKLAMPHGEFPVDAKKLELADWEAKMDAWFEQSLRTYKSNGRPAVIELATQDGKMLERFQMGDRTLAQYRFRVSLPPGRYRLRIAQVFPGTRFEDTCIAELQFRDLKEPAPIPPQELPEPLRPFAGSERCRAASKLKLLPQEVTFLGTTLLPSPFLGPIPKSSADVSGVALLIEARSPSGLLLPVLDTLGCTGGRGELTCIAGGEDAREEVLDRADAYPAWEVDLKTRTAKAQGPWEWTGAYKTVGWKVLYRITARPDASRKVAFVVSAGRDNAVVETAQYTCDPLTQ